MMLLLMDMGTDLFPSIFDNFPYCARSDPPPRTLHQFGFSSNIAAQLRQTGGRSRGTGVRVGGVGEKGHAGDRMLVIVRREKDGETVCARVQDGKRRENRRINSHLASPSDLVPRGKRLRGSVQCHDGRSGAQIIHNCIGNAADVDVVPPLLEDERRSA